MKNKILKTILILALILTLTMVNFIFVGANFVSYAAEKISTNHANVEFDAYFKNEKGEGIQTLEILPNNEEQILYINLNVKKEGYFNGKLQIKNSNFNILKIESEFVNKVEGNTIYLNQINTGSKVEIPVKIKPITNDKFNVGLLNMNSKIVLEGEYKDSTQKDININSEREITLKLVENNTEDDLINNINIVTNKIIELNGEEKRVVQFSLDLGVNNNNYPIKNIISKINVPEIDGNKPEILEVTNLNNMSKYEYKYENDIIEFELENEVNSNSEILWNKNGNENIIITYIYPKDINLENIEIKAEEKVTLYDENVITAKTTSTILDNEEKDYTISVETNNTETNMYKGNLYSGIDRVYNSITTLNVNLANTGEQIKIKENNSFKSGEKLGDANIIYQTTYIRKEDFDKIFGEKGIMTIKDEDGKVITTINKDTSVNEYGDMIIEYNNVEAKNIEIETSEPIKEGKIELRHSKIIKQNDRNIVKNANSIETNLTAQYIGKNKKGLEITTTSNIELKETVTEARLEINKDTLSTVIKNNLEMKVILKTNSEKCDLYDAPVLNIELPENVEQVEVNNIDLIFEEELKIKNYEINGRNIKIYLEGKQTKYKEASIEGAVIVINANVTLNRKTATQDSNIKMQYINKNVNTYVDNKNIGETLANIKLVAPKDVTTINSISELGIETIGQEANKKVDMKKGQDKKSLNVQVEVINNNSEAIKDIKILGDFPTDSQNNNLGAKVTSNINMENAKIYYSENENATDNLQDENNQWKENIENNENVKKYLIQYDNLEPQQSIVGTYSIEVPKNLEYNQKATEGYTVNYTNTISNITNQMNSTDIELDTGVGPKLETTLTATVGDKNISSSETIKNGEVIKYHIEISNTGSEDIKNAVVTGKIPEGTTLVVPQENYEYTGSSYYKEVATDKYEEKIENLKIGEKAIIEYEVRVNKDTQNATKIINSTETKYGEAINESNELYNLSETGNLSISVKRVTDRKIDLYNYGSVQYYVMVENISDQKQDNVKVSTNLPENLKVERLTLITGLGTEEVNDDDIYIPGSGKSIDLNKVKEDYNIDNSNVKSEQIEYSEKINIGTLEPGETKVLSYDMLINKTENNIIKFSALAQDNNKTYKSNIWQDEVNNMKLSMSIKTNTESKYVKAGDIIEYTINIKNDTPVRAEGITFTDSIPKSLSINKITFDGEEVKGIEDNDIELKVDIMENGECEIKIETVVNYSDARDEAETITNKAQASFIGEILAETIEISHIIEANSTEPDDGGDEGNTGDNEGDNNDGDSDIAEGTKMISGLAWYDANGNGKKDSDEKTLRNIKVKLLNANTNNLVKDENGNILEITTDDNGLYVLDNIVNGKYIVIFEYNTAQYTVTKYKVADVDESINSDVMISELTIENNKQKVASTDIINIENENISDINIGLIELKTYDLKLDKYVSKMIVQNSAGTTVKEFNNETLAKIEIDSKQLKGTTVLIEYKINVSNIGEVEGYAKKIADYIPNDLQFSSELNKDWYLSNGVLYNTSLANEKILAGETKTLTLTLTKTLNENNLGRINNTAEIAESYNELGLEDVNSTPGNKVQGENDMNYADVIISLRTGGAVYIGITIIVIAILSVVAVVVIRNNKKFLKKEI